MTTTMAVGCIVIASALALCTFLVLWSRRTIDRIARNGFRSAREIEREMKGEG